MVAEKDTSLTIAKVLRRVSPLAPIALHYNEWRHDCINRELLPLFEAALAKVGESESPWVPRDNDGPIWVFWWQGFDKAPDCVRACINSIRANAGGRKVVLITSENSSEYTCLPGRVYDLVQSGVITLTHLSDLLRHNLLRHHGGLWMDASMYASREIFNLPDRAIFTCSGYPDEVHFNISSGRWLGGLIGGPAGNSLFCFMDEFFKRYWESRNSLLDYFLIDYAVNYAWEHNVGGFAAACREAEGRQPKLFDLRQYLNQTFDEAVWRQLSAHTTVFMVNYKWLKTIKHGSFADVLLSTYLNDDC